jgi:hypothetical protein
MKVVINRCFGGFSITKEAAEFMAARGNAVAKADLNENKGYWYGYGCAENYSSYNRTDPDLVAAVETLGEKANGYCAELSVVEIPDDVEYEILDYDGIESIVDVKRHWC